MIMPSLIPGLRAWAAEQGSNVQAAVDLLVVHDHWLRDEEFAARCVYPDGPLPALSFSAVQRYCDRKPASSEGQLAVLQVVADLGLDRWRFAVMDGRNLDRVVSAVSRATGIIPPGDSGAPS
jgi:hypothetical protein